MGRSKIFKKRRPTLRSLSRKVEALEEDVELKEISAFAYSIDGVAAATNLSTPIPKLFLLNTVAQGDSTSEHLGDEYRTTSVRVGMKITPASAIDYTGVNDGGWRQAFRVLLLVDKNPEGVGPQCWGPSPTAAGAKPFLFDVNSASYLSETTPYNTKDKCYLQYDVLYDKLHYFRDPQPFYNSTLVDTRTPFPTLHVEIKKKLHRKVACYPSGVGTIAGLITNSIYLMVVAVGNVTNINYTVLLDTTVFFKDN